MKLIRVVRIVKLVLFFTLSSSGGAKVAFSSSDPSVMDRFACPILELKETSRDCPYAATTRAALSPLYKEALQAIKTLSPEVLDQIDQDRTHKGLLSLWGESFNFDENAKGTIVELKILSPILRRMGAPAPRGEQKRIVHAGVEHTYGYLFSNLATPYGFKRARWVDEKIATGFELPLDAISPKPSNGTLMANVTRLFGEIAMRNETENLKRLRDATPHAADAIKKLNTSRLKIGRLTEAFGQLELRTDIVQFTQGALLIYSVHNRSNHSKVSTQLITGFPIERGFAKSVLDPARAGENETIISRYNAYIKGVTDSKTPVLGMVSLSGAPASEF